MTQADTTASSATFLPGEWGRVVLSSAAFFMILCSYYILRPMRDEMAVQIGADRVQWLFTGTFLLSVLVVPVFGWVVNRVARAQVLPLSFGFLVLNLLCFCIAFALHGASVSVAATFFIWLSVFNLFVVSLFWSNVSDCFGSGEAQRLYGYIAAGGTAGALAGPLVTVVLARQVTTPYLVGLSALLLSAAAVCMLALRRLRPIDAQDALPPVGGSMIAGIGLTMRLPSLRGVALLVIFTTAVSTALYVEMVDLAGKTYTASGDRKSFFASVDLIVNCLSLLLQILGTRHIVRRYGLRLLLPGVPLLVLAGLGALSVSGTIIAYALVQCLHRTLEYAVSRPAREMIYTTVDPESRFKAKNFIDVTVYRANDAASAWAISLVRGMGWNAIFIIGIPAAIAWVVSAARLGALHDRSNGRSSDRDST